MILAVDLGATKLRCALVDAQGTIHAREAIRTPFDASLASSLDAIARRVLGASSVSSAVVMCRTVRAIDIAGA